MDWHNHDKDIAYRRCRYFILLGFCFTTEIKSLHELTLVNLQLLQPASPSQQWPCNANPDVLRAHNTGGKWGEDSQVGIKSRLSSLVLIKPVGCYRVSDGNLAPR